MEFLNMQPGNVRKLGLRNPSVAILDRYTFYAEKQYKQEAKLMRFRERAQVTLSTQS